MAKSANKLALQTLLWGHFDRRRTREMGGNADPSHEGFISLGVPVGSSHREDIEQMARAATPSFSIVSISEQLDEKRSIRGNTYHDHIGCQIDQILENYPGMLWWMEKDGLVIDTVTPDTSRLREFDRKAGRLVCNGGRNGRLLDGLLRNLPLSWEQQHNMFADLG
jgi:hypothetical protein